MSFSSPRRRTKFAHRLALPKDVVPSRRRRRGRLRSVERLEERALLTVSLIGVPSWDAQGPAPIVFVPPGPVGNVTGAVETIAVKPGDPNTVLAGSANGGIWKTTDANDPFPLWKPTTDQFPSLSIGSIEYSPLDPTHNTLYAATADVSAGFGDGEQQGLVLRSTDGGNTWSLLGSSLVNQFVANIVPTAQGTGLADQTVLATTSQGVWRSTDGGQTFTNLSGTNGLPTGSASSLIVDPNNNARFFVAVPGQGVFRSDDSGATWTPASGSGASAIDVAPVIPSPGATPEVNIRILLAMYDDGVSTALYAAIIRNNVIISPGDNHDPNRVTALYRSTDLGATWRLIQNQPALLSTDGQAEIHAALAADPTNSSIVFLAAAAPTRFQVVASDANPANDTWNSVNPANGTSPHDDPRALVFDANDNLVESDDGGVFRLITPDVGATRTWQALGGSLETIEFYSVAYDTLNGTIFGGAQDNGSSLEQAPNTPANWVSVEGSDGGVSAVDNDQIAHPGTTLEYTDAQGLGSLTRRTVNALNQKTNEVGVGLAISGTATTLTGAGGLSNGAGGFVFDNTIQFINIYKLNAVDPTRMMIGTSFLYESLPSYSPNAGDTLKSLGGTTVLPMGAAPTNPIANQISATQAGITTAIAYGGMLNGAPDPDVAYIGTTGGTVNGVSGKLIRRFSIASAGNPSLSDFTTLSSYPGTTPQGIALDPTNDRVGYVLDQSNHVYRFVNGGTNAADWTDITGDLRKTADVGFGGTQFVSLRSIAVVPTGAQGGLSIVVGGAGGVFVTSNPLDGASALWTKLGANMPNALVKDLQYIPPNSVDPAKGDILLAGVFGRGAWILSNASTVVNGAGVLQINGDQDFPNEDDTIKLEREAGNPLLLDVFLNSTTPVLTVPLATLKQINVNGLGGNDTLIVDSTNGLINVPNGIRFDGGTGNNNLDLVQTGGPDQASDTYTVNTNPGQGSDVIVGGLNDTQTVFFQNLAPVFDSVPGPLTVNGTPANNVINYSQGTTTANGLVTVDAFEPIEFTNKTSLTIQAQAGDDTITVNNPNTPTGLTALTVDGGTGNNTLVVNANNQLVLSSNIDAFTVSISGATPVPVGYSNIAYVRVINANDQLAGVGTVISAVEGVPLNNVFVASFSFTDPVPPPVLGSAEDFTAMIDWGDGFVPTAGTIATNGTNGFQVFGTHTYTEDKVIPYSVSVTITDKGSTRSFTPPGGVPVTIIDNAGATTSLSPIKSSAIVADAPLVAQAGPISATEGIPFAGGLVATFTDSDPSAMIGDYTAAINWGDGTPSTFAVITQPSGFGTPFNVSQHASGGHIYTEEGTYKVVVRIADLGGSVVIVSTSAIVADTPPVAAPINFTVLENQNFTTAVASFNEVFSGAPEPSTDYTATIDWGDGTPPTLGLITDRPGGHQVVGQHTYLDSRVNGGSGIFNVTVTIHDDGGTLARVVSTATVKDIPIVLLGQLDPATDTGVSHTDAITKDNQPNFFGTSEPDSKVMLFAQTGGNAPVLVGQTEADSSGAWSITSNKLADGAYTMSVIAIDHAGFTTAFTQLLPNAGQGPLVIDTVGPKVTSVTFNRLNGGLNITFQDDRTGMDQLSVRDGANYQLTKPHVKVGNILVTALATLPPPSPSSPQPVMATINSGQRLKGGTYYLTIKSGGIEDVAGNALDGEFYGYFPSGNNIPGGDFQARIDTIHHLVLPPQPLYSSASPNVPPGTPGGLFIIGHDASGNPILVPAPSGVAKRVSHQFRQHTVHQFLPAANVNAARNGAALQKAKKVKVAHHDAAIHALRVADPFERFVAEHAKK
jgi:hypothetical protein